MTTCQEALQQLTVVDLSDCNLDRLASGGQVITADDETFWSDTLCPPIGPNGDEIILPQLNLTESQIVVASRPVAGCADVIQVTKPSPECDNDGTLVVSILIDDPTTDCSEKCRGVNYYHHAVQLPAGVPVGFQVNYTESCADESFAYREYSGDFLFTSWMALAVMVWMMVRC